MNVRANRLTVLAGILVFSASCRTAQTGSADPAGSAPPIVQPGAPGQPSKVITADKSRDLSAVQYTGADIKFMQGMIGHHAQAVEMVALVPQRTASDAVRKLALRIDVSQQDEMKMMREWLLARRPSRSRNRCSTRSKPCAAVPHACRAARSVTAGSALRRGLQEHGAGRRAAADRDQPN